MQIVIDVPDNLLNDNGRGFTEFRFHAQNGTLYRITTDIDKYPYFAKIDFTELPKHHGDLIDRTKLLKQYGLENATKYGNKGAEQQKHSYSTMMMYEIADMIEDAETIIPATKETSGCKDCVYEHKLDAKCLFCDKQTATKEGNEK